MAGSNPQAVAVTRQVNNVISTTQPLISAPDNNGIAPTPKLKSPAGAGAAALNNPISPRARARPARPPRVESPDRKFDHAVLRAKLRVLHFDPQRTSIAVGALARLTDSKAGEKRIENKPLSLLGIVTTELFPFREWGGFLINGYIDNRVAVAGLKVQIYRFIQAVAEFDFFHSSDIDDREQTKAGIEIEGETDFYFQIFWAERSERALVQIGVGF